MCYTYLVISEAFRLPSNLLFTWFGVALMIGIAVTTVPKRQKLPWSEQENKHPRNRNRKFKLIQSNSITYPNIDINHCFYLHSIETFDISVLAFPDYCCIFMLFFPCFLLLLLFSFHLVFSVWLRFLISLLHSSWFIELSSFWNLVLLGVFEFNQ